MADQRDEQTIQPPDWLQRIGNSVYGRLRRIGKLRDGFLLVAATTYVLGWFVWALNALENNLGLLPALESQYFVAGIIPLLIIVSIYWGIRGLILFRKQYDKWLPANLADKGLKMLAEKLTAEKKSIEDAESPDKNRFEEIKEMLRSIRRKQLLSRAISWSCLLSFLTFIFLGSYIRQFAGLDVTMPAFWVFLALLFFLPLSSKGLSWFLYWYRRLVIITLIIALGFGGIFSYFYTLYPYIPQELGGLRPRTAYLDVAKAELSKETLQEIFPSGVFDTSSEIVQSNKVNVYYSGRDFILVKLYGQDQGVTRSTYEIKQSAIQAIRWSD